MATGIDEELDQDQQQYSDLPKGATVVTPPASGSTPSYSDLPQGASVAGNAPPAPSSLERGMGAFNKGVGMDMSAPATPPPSPSILDIPMAPVRAAKSIVQSSGDAAQTGANRFHQPGITNKIGGELEYALSGIPVVGPGIVTAMEHGAKQEWPEMLGSTAAAATQMAAPEIEESGAGIGNTIDAMNPINWRNGIRSKMYDANGELTPGAHAIVHPTELAEYGAKKLFPEPEDAVKARNANANYEQTGSDLMRRGVQQDRIDAKSARANQSIVKANDAALAEDAERSKFEPFKPNPRTAELIKSVPSSGASGRGSVTGRGLSGVGERTPFYKQQQSIAPEESLIAEPGSKAPDLKTTYQSYKGPKLQELMDAGDTDAIKEFIRNPRPGAHLPPNAKFLLEEADRTPWRNLTR